MAVAGVGVLPRTSSSEKLARVEGVFFRPSSSGDDDAGTLDFWSVRGALWKACVGAARTRLWDGLVRGVVWRAERRARVHCAWSR